MSNLNRSRLVFPGFLFVLLVVSLFVNLGVAPLYLEEPRRAFLALEMWFNNNLIVPTEYGAFYYEKPPFWNWVILLGFELFGQTEFAARFFTPVSLLVMGMLLFFSVKKYIGLKEAIYSTLFFLVSVDIYFHFSQLAEIDLFYSLITFTSILVVFIFYQKKNFGLLFPVFYLLNAVGFLTKAFPSLIFVGVTLAVFFWYKRDLKHLFHWAHWVGVFLFLIIVGGYFYLYNQANDASVFIKELWGSSSRRTVTHDHQTLNVLAHIFIFPLEILKNLLPAGILILFAFNKRAVKIIKSNPFAEFSFFIVLGNLIVYWFSPGANQRYIYMLYPFVIVVLTYLYFHLKSTVVFASKVFTLFMYAVMGIFTLACSVIPFIKDLQVVPNLLILSIIFGFVFLVLCYLFYRNKQIRLLLFIGAFILFRLFFDFTYLPYRSIDSWPQRNKDDAVAISQIVGNDPVFMYHKRLSRTTVFYLERETQKVLPFKNEFNKTDFFIVPESLLKDVDPTVYYKFRNKRNSELFYLIRF